MLRKRPRGERCRACEGVVVQAPAPARLIEGGLPTEATVAQVMVSRYADHLPLYRQAGMLARQGILVDRATLAGWVGTAAAEVAPVVRRMKAMLLASARLFADETSVPVLDPGRGRTKTGWFWTIARDDRPWGGADPPAVIYTYAPGRGREHARALLGGYRGILQCDGYGPYKALAGPAIGPGPAVVACCQGCRRAAPWRRRSATRCATARGCCGSSTMAASNSTPTASSGQRGRWRSAARTRFSPAATRGRKPGPWAAIASLIETCKLNGVDPQRYLTDLLTRLVEGWPQSRIDELMPWCWSKAGQA